MPVILSSWNQIMFQDDIDKMVSAEITDPDTNPRLHAIMPKYNMHGPCGKLNKNSGKILQGLWVAQATVTER